MGHPASLAAGLATGLAAWDLTVRLATLLSTSVAVGLVAGLAVGLAVAFRDYRADLTVTCREGSRYEACRGMLRRCPQYPVAYRDIAYVTPWYVTAVLLRFSTHAMPRKRLGHDRGGGMVSIGDVRKFCVCVLRVTYSIDIHIMQRVAKSCHNTDCRVDIAFMASFGPFWLRFGVRVRVRVRVRG